jgi:hypothetical protein
MVLILDAPCQSGRNGYRTVSKHFGYLNFLPVRSRDNPIGDGLASYVGFRHSGPALFVRFPVSFVSKYSALPRNGKNLMNSNYAILLKWKITDTTTTLILLRKRPFISMFSLMRMGPLFISWYRIRDSQYPISYLPQDL